MKKINLKDDQLQLYKRENSNLWQIKVKLPKQKAIRSHFADFKPSSSAKHLQYTYKKFPKLTTIIS